jgi:SAM-dependent methyltransferase
MMLADWLRYDFGYDWPWTMGHALAGVVFALITWGAWRLRRRWLALLFAALTIWAMAAGISLNGIMRFSRPIEMPSAAFLAGGRGQVLDLGAGSGRSSLMVLLARPEARVTALDIFSSDYGMPDNTPDRLRANARAAGADARLDVQAGDMRSMPFGDASFDAGVSAFAIDHLNREDRRKTYAELRRVIRPGGDFLLMVVNNDAWIRFTLPILLHHGYFGPRTNAERWREELTAAGFEVAEQGFQPGALYVLVRNRAASGS